MQDRLSTGAAERQLGLLKAQITQYYALSYPGEPRCMALYDYLLNMKRYEEALLARVKYEISAKTLSLWSPEKIQSMYELWNKVFAYQLVEARIGTRISGAPGYYGALRRTHSFFEEHLSYATTEETTQFMNELMQQTLERTVQDTLGPAPTDRRRYS